MTDSEYEAFVVIQTAGYAAANVESGNWGESEASERSKKADAELLPLGLSTPRMLLRKAENAEGEIVGQLWINWINLIHRNQAHGFISLRSRRIIEEKDTDECYCARLKKRH